MPEAHLDLEWSVTLGLRPPGGVLHSAVGLGAVAKVVHRAGIKKKVFLATFRAGAKPPGTFVPRRGRLLCRKKAAENGINLRCADVDKSL